MSSPMRLPPRILLRAACQPGGGVADDQRQLSAAAADSFASDQPAANESSAP